MSRRFRQIAFGGLLAAILAAALPWLVRSDQGAPGAAPQGGAVEVPVQGAAADAGMPGAIATEDRGSARTFELALDEAVRRGPDGKDVTVRLDPPATPGTLAARLRGIPGDVLPVCFEEGRPRTEVFRRIITRDITLRIATGKDVPALPGGVVLKERPDYAPEYVVVSAADPFAAIAALDPLRRRPGVVSADIQLASRQAPRALPSDPLFGNQWHLKYQGQSGAQSGTDVNVEDAWLYGGSGGVRGAGVRIGIVDDGLQTNHPDLAANVDTANDKDWNGNDNDPSPAASDRHGTPCAGNAAARGNNGIGVTGTAPEATLVGMRLIAAATTDSQEAEALGYLPDLIEIKSNSWGPNDESNVLEGPGPLTRAAIANAAATGRGGLGSIFLWAGGNGREYDDNSNNDGYANDIHTIAVGASDSLGRQSSYSESGANLVVVAPSSGSSLSITTTDLTGKSGYNGSNSNAGGDYTNSFSGTSSATPTAAGIVALMLERSPALNWRDVQEILIGSAAKISPADPDWIDNAGGYHFNHKFGAGLIDAAAAVTMAASWTSLPAALSQAVPMSGGSVAIPDNDPTGITRAFVFGGPGLRAEHVTVHLDIVHTYRGDLEILLTSPSGTASVLAEKRGDGEDDYPDWTFSSVRHWGEDSAGTWSLKVTDKAAVDEGSLNAATVTIHGTANPAPVVQIVSPEAGGSFGPGSSVAVEVSASDLNANGTQGTVASVQLLQDGTPVGTDTSAPFEFMLEPSPGSHTLTAIATDGSGASTTSEPVSFTVGGGYALWIAGFPGLAGAGEGDDPDHDGMINFLEYYFGSSPGSPDAAVSLPVIARNGDTLTLTWWHSKAATDVTGTAEWSDALGSWHSGGIFTEVTGESPTHRQLRATLTLVPEDARKFLRLRVE